MTQDKQSFEEILESYHVTLENNRRDESIKLAAEKYAAQFQLENKQVGAGVWVKASERLPEKFKPVVVRNVHNGKVQTMANMTHSQGFNTGLDDFLYSETEWLDEHPQQPTLEAISAMAEKELNKLQPSATKKELINYGISMFTSALGYSAGDNWISVEGLDGNALERDEKFSEPALLFTKHETIAVGKKDWHQGHNPHFWNTDEGDLDIEDVTHWQPLPKPPIKKQ